MGGVLTSPVVPRRRDRRIVRGAENRWGVTNATKINITDATYTRPRDREAIAARIAAVRAQLLRDCIVRVDLQRNSLGGPRPAGSATADSAWETVCLMEALKGCGVEQLNLQYNNLGIASGGALAAFLEVDSELAVLDLSVNKLQEGSEAIAAVLCHASDSALTSISLRHNSIGDRGAEAFAELLRSRPCRIQHLDLSYNSISQEGVVSLARAIAENEGLQAINLEGNGVGREGAEALAEAVLVNPTLEELTVSDNPNVELPKIDTEGYFTLVQAVTQVNSRMEQADSYREARSQMLVALLVGCGKRPPLPPRVCMAIADQAPYRTAKLTWRGCPGSTLEDCERERRRKLHHGTPEFKENQGEERRARCAEMQRQQNRSRMQIAAIVILLAVMTQDFEWGIYVIATAVALGVMYRILYGVYVRVGLAMAS